MTVTIYLNIPYRARPQQRHRHARNGRAYDPSSEYKKEFLRMCRLTSLPPSEPVFAAAVSIKIMCTFLRPASHLTRSGTLRKGVPVRHVYKPDTDNLAKFIMDALNGVYYNDDSQIDSLHVAKRYGDEDSVRVQLDYAG